MVGPDRRAPFMIAQPCSSTPSWLACRKASKTSRTGPVTRVSDGIQALYYLERISSGGVVEPSDPNSTFRQVDGDGLDPAARRRTAGAWLRDPGSTRRPGGAIDAEGGDRGLPSAPVVADHAADREAERAPNRPAQLQGGGAQPALGPYTYVPTLAGFPFLAVVLDSFSRRVIGWAMGPSVPSSPQNRCQLSLSE
jgi:hypothetical protein